MFKKFSRKLTDPDIQECFKKCMVEEIQIIAGSPRQPKVLAFNNVPWIRAGALSAIVFEGKIYAFKADQISLITISAEEHISDLLDQMMLAETDAEKMMDAVRRGHHDGRNDIG